MTTPPAHPPLNIFQRIIRQWEQVHPYNGGQILVVSSSPPAQEVEQAWNDALLSLGLGALHLDDGENTYHYNGFATGRAWQSVPELPPGASLESHLSDELNRPFADEGFPFRPFILRDGDRCHLGVVYRHWVADSVSIRLLIQQWFVRLFDPAAARSIPARQPDHGYWGYFGPSRGGWHLASGILGVPRNFNRFRRVRRVRTLQAKETACRFTCRASKAGLADALRAEARRRGVNLHDFFIAAAAWVCRDHLRFRDAPRRDQIAIASIVDLRPYSSADLSDTFGLFLGFSSVFCDPDDFADFDRLVCRVAEQNRREKETRAPASGIVSMGTSMVARRLFSPRGIDTYYRKHMPLAGGVSTICLDHSFAAKYHPSPLLDYLRISPTGPMVPLAFAPTTLGGHLGVGLTHQRACIDDATAHAVLADFLDRLAKLV